MKKNLVSVLMMFVLLALSATALAAPNFSFDSYRLDFSSGRCVFDGNIRIVANGCNLNIPRYIDTYEEEEPIDLHDVMHRLHDLEARRADLDRQIDAYFAELGLTDLVK